MPAERILIDGTMTRKGGGFTDLVNLLPRLLAELARLHREGHSRAEIARRLGRRPNAIAKRVEKLKLEGLLENGGATSPAAEQSAPGG